MEPLVQLRWLAEWSRSRATFEKRPFWSGNRKVGRNCTAWISNTPGMACLPCFAPEKGMVQRRQTSASFNRPGDSPLHSLWNSRVNDLGGDCALLLDKFDVIGDAIEIDKAKNNLCKQPQNDCVDWMCMVGTHDSSLTVCSHFCSAWACIFPSLLTLLANVLQNGGQKCYNCSTLLFSSLG